MSLPAYRKRTIRGRLVAFVTLTDYTLHVRRDYWLGEYDSPESREKYARLVTAWESAGRRLPIENRPTMTVVEVLVAYLRQLQTAVSSNEYGCTANALQVVQELYGRLPATSFGPNSLRNVRDRMVSKGWRRTYINSQIQRVRRAFKWAVSHEMIPSSVFEAIRTIEPLRAGRSNAPEAKNVPPARPEDVAAVHPFVSAQVWDLIQLQQLTGARAGELVRLRPMDLDQSQDVWVVVPGSHKTAWRGKKRAIFFGPRAQAVLRPRMLRPADNPMFSPAEAETARRQAKTDARVTPEGQGNSPGTNIKASPRRRPAEAYTVVSYRRAIARACERADLWAHGGQVVGNDEILVQHWAPHQLRHSAATNVRKEFGLEAAQLVLGHSSALVTDAVYAERDIEKVMGIIRKIG